MPEIAVVPNQGSGEPDEAGTLASVATSTPADAGAGQPPREGAESGGWPDALAEAAFLAEARVRGEIPAPGKAREEIAEETDAQPLPALDELVQRIPPEVREALADLFRARFVRVARVPRKALKN